MLASADENRGQSPELKGQGEEGIEQRTGGGDKTTQRILAIMADFLDGEVSE